MFSTDTKYLRLDDDTIIIFSNHLTHSNVAFRMNYSKKDIQSAGFFRIIDGKINCHGRSDSLGVDISSIDNLLIGKMLFGCEYTE